MKEFGKSFWGNLVAYVSILLITALVLIVFNFQNRFYRPINIVNPTVALKDSVYSANAFVKIVEVQKKIDELHRLKDKGILLTPQEYTNNIVNFYNTFIVILVLFISLFSLISYQHLQRVAKEEAQKETRAEVRRILREDSEIKKALIEVFKGETENVLLEFKDEIEAQIDLLAQRIPIDPFKGKEDDSELGDALGKIGNSKIKS